jgi:monoamine oxidase
MREAYGTEPPGDEPGWTYTGSGRWTMDDAAKRRVAIIGGGPGGLFAAYILGQRLPGTDVTIFEASRRAGGKIKTDEFQDGAQFEAGVAELYEYKGPGGGDPLRLLIEEDLDLETVDISGGGVIMDGKIMRDMEEVEVECGYDTRKRIEAFHAKMAELMPLEKYAQRWQPDNDHPWAKKKFREHIEDELRGPDGVDEQARHYIETAVHSDLATESHTCNGLNGIKNVLMDNDAYMQLYHVVGGIERVVDGMLEKIRAKVQTSTRVTAVSKSGDKYSVSFLKEGRRTLKMDVDTFDAVVVCLPNHWLRTIRWDGKMADAIHEIVAHYDLPAHYLRVTMLFDDKWWEELDMPGEFWMMDTCNGLCCYDESTRWGVDDEDGEGKDNKKTGHVLSFLIAGGDALLMCSSNQSKKCVVDYVLHSLPPAMRQDAEDHLVDSQVDRFIGSINAQPGGWPSEELRGEHSPEPDEHPGILLCGDFFFDSTLNGALMSANIAVELLLEHFGEKSAKVTRAVEQLESKDTGV